MTFTLTEHQHASLDNYRHYLKDLDRRLAEARCRSGDHQDWGKELKGLAEEFFRKSHKIADQLEEPQQ